MTSIALFGLKGGCSKTTLAVSLAQLATKRGSVALVDLDPQESASDWATKADNPRIRLVTQGQALTKKRMEELTGHNQTVVVDTPPRMTQPAISAAILCDVVIIPIRVGAFDELTIKRTLDEAISADKSRARVGIARPSRKIMVLVHTRANTRDADRIYADLCENFAKDCELPELRVLERVAHDRAFRNGQTAETFEPKGKAADELRALYTYIERTP